MATVLDAYPLIALLRAEPAADEVEAILREGNAAMSAVNLAETLDVLERRFAVPNSDLRSALGQLISAGLEVRGVSEPQAWRAAELRARRYARQRCELSLADCFALSSVGEGDRLATADRPLAEAARAEGLAVTPLPDSQGQRP
jgi:uncharacterized protein with PIN domain